MMRLSNDIASDKCALAMLVAVKIADLEEVN